MTFSDWLTKNEYDENKLTPSMRTHLQAAWRSELPFASLADGTSRESAIRALAEKYLTSAGSSARSAVEAAAETAVSENWSINRAELELLRASRNFSGIIPTPPAGSGDVQADVLVVSLAMHAGAPERAIAETFRETPYRERVMNVAQEREHRGATFHSIIRSVLQAAGEHVPHGRITDQHIRRCFELARGDGIMSVGGPSTLSLPGILGDAAHKISLAAFNATAVVWPTFCKVVDLMDFKAHTSHRLINAGSFTLLPPGGEITHGTLTEASAALTADTYAEMLAIDRRDLRNDDMSKFSMVPAMLGRNGAVRVERDVFTLLLANANNFFGTGNKNLSTGGGSVLALAGLDAAFKLQQQQLDANNDPVLIVPKVVLVPPALFATARSLLLRDTIIAGTATAAQPNLNPWAGLFEPTASPYLAVSTGIAGASDTAWYLLAGPSDFAIIQVGFLDGRVQPIIEQAQMDFDRLGISLRGVLDFDASFLEPKGGVKSNGS